MNGPEVLLGAEDALWSLLGLLGIAMLVLFVRDTIAMWSVRRAYALRRAPFEEALARAGQGAPFRTPDADSERDRCQKALAELAAEEARAISFSRTSTGRGPG